MVLSLVLGSITIKAESPYTYTYYIVLANGGYQIWYSDKEVEITDQSGIRVYDPNTGTNYEFNYTGRIWVSEITSNALIATWNGDGWSYSLPVYTMSDMSTLDKTMWGYDPPMLYLDDYMRDGFPEPPANEDIQEIIQGELNGTTQVTTQANVYIANITNVYNTYTAGNITLEEAKQEVEANVDSLSDLAQEPTATLKDAITVQNGLTYGQIVNDTLLQEQEEAYWNERDIDSSVSTKVQQSDQEEIDYLESLIAETEKTISELSPSKEFTSEQISTASEIVEGVWENPIIKKIIPVAACFMVVCVVLGVKYRL